MSYEHEYKVFLTYQYRLIHQQTLARKYQTKFMTQQRRS